MSAQEIGAVIVLVGAVGSVILACWKWLLPKLRGVTADMVAVRDTLVGREAVRDSITGKERLPALPGIGVRMAHQEERMAELTQAVTAIAETQVQLANHEERITALEAASVERIVTKAESAQAWRAVEAAYLADPDIEAPGPE